MEHPRIHRDPAIMVGKPCIKGTRVTVEHVLRALSQRVTVDVVLEEYPRLTREDVLPSPMPLTICATKVSSPRDVARCVRGRMLREKSGECVA